MSDKYDEDGDKVINPKELKNLLMSLLIFEKPQVSYTYLFKTSIKGKFYYKIGKANNVYSRKNSIESSIGYRFGKWCHHEIIIFSSFQEPRDALIFEAYLHKIFDKNRRLFLDNWDGST